MIEENVIIEVGEISLEVIELLGLSLAENTPIYVGVTNIAHMVKEHSYEFNRYYLFFFFLLSQSKL